MSYKLELSSTTLLETIGNSDLQNFFDFGKINKTGGFLIFGYNINCTHINICPSLMFSIDSTLMEEKKLKGVNVEEK